jgi:hypothetical protein
MKFWFNKPPTQTNGINNTRRSFIQWLTAGAGLTIASKTEAANALPVSSLLLQAAEQIDGKTVVTIYRPHDLLELQLEFTGYTKSPDGKGLTRTGSAGLLKVTFPPQSIAEEAYEETGGTNGQANLDASAKAQLGENKAFTNSNVNGLAQTYISGDSRLVYAIPASKKFIAFTAQDLLNWTGYKLEVNSRATCVPTFSINDGIDVFDNPFIKDGNLPNLPKEINNKPQEPSQPRVNQTMPQLRKPRTQNNNLRSDTTNRQLQINRNLRAATREEAQVVQQQSLPVAALRQTNDFAWAAGVNLKQGKTPRPIDASETSIELPYRLFISPNQLSKWQHQHQLKNREDLQGQQVATYELWHSRLLSTDCDGNADVNNNNKLIKTIRALWGTDIDGKWDKKPMRDYSPDGTKNNGNGANKFLTALYNDDRHCIVHETSNYALPNKFSPKSVQIENLLLSCLGASINASLLVNRKELEAAGLLGSLNLLKWKHIATLARDHYVEVVYAGNMFPLGHEAALVRITERKPKNNFAANYQRYFLVVNEEEKKYLRYNPNNGNFKEFPFSTIKFITTLTPPLDPITQTFTTLNDNTQLDHQFLPKVNGKIFKWKLQGYDLDGNETNFEMPLVFVSTNVSFLGNGYNIANIGKIVNEYNKDDSLRQINFNNQKLSLARSKTAGDTSFETSSILFEARATLDESPGFRPGTKKIDIYVSAVENLLGKREPVSVKLIDDKNKGDVFAELLAPTKVSFSSQTNKTGGSISPDFGITSISKTLGAVGGKVSDLANLKFEPETFFDSKAKLFGVIEISKIIKAVQNAVATVSGETVQSTIPALKNIEIPDGVITQYIWTGGQLAKYDAKLFSFKPNATGSEIKVISNLYRYNNSSKPNVLTVESTIKNFKIEIFDLAQVNVKNISFKTGSNAKMDVSVDMEKEAITFLGPLSFVNKLQEYIPADGFSDPPFLDVSLEGIKTGYTLALPDIQLGAFSCRNINLGATVNLPFTGAPLTLRFNFCEKHQPFTLTVSALGGGGFFAIEFDINGVRSLEAALEFGAAVSVNFGVASGAVSIMGGIYIKLSYTDTGKQMTLEGYVRVNGAVCVLGLITASIEFLLTLTGIEETVNGKKKYSRVYGTATLKIKVEVFMFSKTVTLTTTKEFAGAGADPTFGMLIDKPDWLQYCETFAA